MYQRLVLVGYLGRDPEMRYTPQGTPVTSLNVATNRRYNTADGQQKEETLWFRVSVWGKQAEFANQYLNKGRKVLIEGTLTGDENGGPRIWTDKEGKPRASFEVRALTVQFLDSKRDVAANAQPANGPVVAEAAVDEPVAREDLPF
ncbi:MAG: single-stranded DNA-binding protein [Chloroflexi bacterium]|nr:single-stranded DNA-binding protein [Chloroflexota bacterium]